MMAAFGLVRYQFPGKGLFTGVILVPLIVPGLLIGISLLSLFHYSGIRTSLVTVWLAHTALALPYTTLIIAARLQGLDASLEEAAASLGAPRRRVLLRVTLPLLGPGLLGAGLFAFTISFGEIIVTYFVSGFHQTLPLQIWSLLKVGITPTVNAISAVIMLVGLLAATAALRFARPDGQA
jgi:spermidine/putrescine transport system permease protein